MRTRITPPATLACFLALAAALTFALHRLGEVRWLSVDWANLSRWLDSTPPADALLAASRLAGLACGWWILLSTLFYLAARASRATFPLRLATPLALPFVRTLAAHSLVGAVAATTLGGALPALASTDRPVATGQLHPFPVPVPTPGSVTPAPGSEALRAEPFLFPHPVLTLENRPIGLPGESLRSAPDGDRTGPCPAPSEASRLEPGDRYRIAPGDNLWDIARRVVSQTSAHPPAVHQIASYWVDVVEANRDTIRSGDPNLIFPDETILLPPTREV